MMFHYIKTIEMDLDDDAKHLMWAVVCISHSSYQQYEPYECIRKCFIIYALLMIFRYFLLIIKIS